MNNHYNWNRKTILIVEDDNTSFLYLSVLFKNQNAQIIKSIDGLDAFFICMTSSPDLVIMDIRLPILNGIDTIRLIKKYQPNIPIICITASVMKEDRLKCTKAGSDAFLSKPVMPSDLLPVVDYFLAKQERKYSMLHTNS